MSVSVSSRQGCKGPIKNHGLLVFIAICMLPLYSYAAPMNAQQRDEAMADYNMGRKSYYGIENLNKNIPNAAIWFEKAAKLGQADAQYMLGQMYYNGEGLKQSDSDAFKWFDQAAQQGNAEAQARLGELYISGRGTGWDYGQARGWYLRAARQGLPSAQAGLGLLYLNGRGGPKDYAEAYFWLTLASRSSPENLSQPMKQAQEHLSKEQIAHLQDKVSAWQPVAEPVNP